VQPAGTARGLESAVAAPSSSPTESVTLEYTDVFLGRGMRILFKLRSQIEQPLMLIKALAHIFLQSQGPPQDIEHRQLSLFPVDCLHAQFWPVQRVRAIFGFSRQVCRVAVLPGSSNLPVTTTGRWKTRILARVLSGLRFKIMVRQRLAASFCAIRLCLSC
jgi:hypothetical protein